MAIPLIYNLRSVQARWTSALVAVVGIAGSVAVFVAMLALANGFSATLAATGSPGNALVRRAGSTSELESEVSLEAVRLLRDAPGVTRGGDGAALASAEAMIVTALPTRAAGTDANVPMRGVGSLAAQVRERFRVGEGRYFTPGLAELVVGRGAARTIAGLELGGQIRFGARQWTVVGIFESGGSALESEVWLDAALLNEGYGRPPASCQSVTVRLESPAAFATFKDAITADPRLDLQVDRESDYFASRSETMTALITTLGGLVAVVMGVGSIFSALNTMYAAVSARTREIATLRALGFGGGAVVLSFVSEALVIAAAGGLLGCLLALTVNGIGVSTMNFQTFSQLAFAFRVTPGLLGLGLLFALVIGLVGGLLPALRAARLPVATALREL
jgi:putative ABC transport system permease protein